MHTLIPAPRELVEHSGSFPFFQTSTIGYNGTMETLEVATLLADYLRPATGFPWPVAEGDGSITLVQTGDPLPDSCGFVPENYTLVVSPEKGVRIEALSAAGLARGIQTLRQLFPAEIFCDKLVQRPWSVPAVEIRDSPEFRWRGLHLDVGRHFFSVDEVCRYIELLAQHRMNMFHWHLTEDQGWRIEIKKYPRLTSVGSVRKKTLVGHHGTYPHTFDNTPYGGFYTQEEVKKVVAFAARRHVTVMPEIDMPGHMGAAIAAYPEWGNGIVACPEVRPMWGISTFVLNLNDATVKACEEIWSELFDLFPSKFFHLGGDEAPTNEWELSDEAQEVMLARGLHSPRAMQSWFTRHMIGFFAAHGRRLVGWEEILDGENLDTAATVMSWRGKGREFDAVRTGHDVVMATNQFLYYDYYQEDPEPGATVRIGGLCPLSRIYNGFKPVPDGMTAADAKHILGAQGQLWTEYIPTMKDLEEMAYPRACALAETLWIPHGQRDYTDFLRRLSAHRGRLAAQSVAAFPRP